MPSAPHRPASTSFDPGLARGRSATLPLTSHAERTAGSHVPPAERGKLREAHARRILLPGCRRVAHYCAVTRAKLETCLASSRRRITRSSGASDRRARARSAFPRSFALAERRLPLAQPARQRLRDACGTAALRQSPRARREAPPAPARPPAAPEAFTLAEPAPGSRRESAPQNVFGAGHRRASIRHPRISPHLAGDRPGRASGPSGDSEPSTQPVSIACRGGLRVSRMKGAP